MTFADIRKLEWLECSTVFAVTVLFNIFSRTFWLWLEKIQLDLKFWIQFFSIDAIQIIQQIKNALPQSTSRTFYIHYLNTIQKILIHAEWRRKKSRSQIHKRRKSEKKKKRQAHTVSDEEEAERNEYQVVITANWL